MDWVAIGILIAGIVIGVLIAYLGAGIPVRRRRTFDDIFREYLRKKGRPFSE